MQRTTQNPIAISSMQITKLFSFLLRFYKTWNIVGISGCPLRFQAVTTDINIWLYTNVILQKIKLPRHVCESHSLIFKAKIFYILHLYATPWLLCADAVVWHMCGIKRESIDLVPSFLSKIVCVFLYLLQRGRYNDPLLYGYKFTGRRIVGGVFLI